METLLALTSGSLSVCFEIFNDGFMTDDTDGLDGGYLKHFLHGCILTPLLCIFKVCWHDLNLSTL